MLLENRKDHFEEPDSPKENTANDFPEKERRKQKPNTTYQLRYPTFLKNLEEEPREPRDQDEQLPEDAVADEFSPPHFPSINVDRFLEPKMENKVEPNEEIPSEEDNEPYEPYQANLEIQRLIERTKLESEEPAQSAPAKIRPKFQVNMFCWQIVARDILEINANGFYY